ncbi:MAG: hypothetical protein AAFY38_16120 [Pseudomonadota bacterium]
MVEAWLTALLALTLGAFATYRSAAWLVRRGAPQGLAAGLLMLIFLTVSIGSLTGLALLGRDGLNPVSRVAEWLLNLVS